MTFRLVHADHDRLSGMQQSEVQIDKDQYECFVKDNVTYWVSKKVELDNNDIESARIIKIVTDEAFGKLKEIEINHEPQGNGPEFTYPDCGVRILLNKNGRSKLESVTQSNVGRRMAVIFERRLLMVPFIAKKIDGGEMWILDLYYEEARRLKDDIDSFRRIGNGKERGEN